MPCFERTCLEDWGLIRGLAKKPSEMAKNGSKNGQNPPVASVLIMNPKCGGVI
jgi:hypothetical protein